MRDISSNRYFAHRWVRSQTTRGYISPYKTLANPTPRKAILSSPKADRPPHKDISTYQPIIMTPPKLSKGPPPRDPRFSLDHILNPTTSHCDKKSCFQCLPKEVRCIIWEYARSRTIGINIHNSHMCSGSPSPITFRINQESRAETKKHYNIYSRFYILCSEHSEIIHYPFFDPKVDSVILNDAFMGFNPARKCFGFHGKDFMPIRFRIGETNDGAHFDVIESLHIPANAWNWRIWESPSDVFHIRLKNLTEIVFQGGKMGLVTSENIEKFKDVVRSCFERAVEAMAEEEESYGGTGHLLLENSGEASTPEVATREIKFPEIRVVMPGDLKYEFMFEEEKLGMESVEERQWVMNFIGKVKANR